MIEEWLEKVHKPGWRWYVKRLSGNDTGLTRGHQVGPYMPKSFIFSLFPSLQLNLEENAEAFIPAELESHGVPERELRVIWYNGKLRGKTRDETRITRWSIRGQGSPVLDPDNTGALCVFAFHQDDSSTNADFLSVWLCNGLMEETIIEDIVGIVEPGQTVYFDCATDYALSGNASYNCGIRPDEMPVEWLQDFPSGAEIIDFAIKLQPKVIQLLPDARLITRRDCEFNLFKSIENAHVLDTVQAGFENVDHFVSYANSISNRRKSRSGKSLELQLGRIFDEEGLSMYSHDKRTEGRTRPDFIFPSIEAYHNKAYSAEKLRMLAVKTTCKDRWRQILTEAERIDKPYLFTLQEGVSEHQFKEMQSENVQLVVPAKNFSSFPESVREHLINLNDFIILTKSLY